MAFPFCFIKGGYMKRYLYDGPVLEFGKCVADRWTASTYAESERKALSNLAYQYKKRNNRVANVPVSLPGNLKIVE